MNQTNMVTFHNVTIQNNLGKVSAFIQLEKLPPSRSDEIIVTLSRSILDYTHGNVVSVQGRLFWYEKIAQTAIENYPPVQRANWTVEKLHLVDPKIVP